MAKYSSNSPEMLEAIPNEPLAPQLHELELNCEELQSHKTLGLSWDPNLHELRITVTVNLTLKLGESFTTVSTAHKNA